jgi:hypothetical protein
VINELAKEVNERNYDSLEKKLDSMIRRFNRQLRSRGDLIMKRVLTVGEITLKLFTLDYKRVTKANSHEIVYVETIFQQD